MEPKNGGVPEGEDPAVGRHEPVALAGRRRRHADHGRVEALAAHGAEERRRPRRRRCRRRKPPSSSPGPSASPRFPPPVHRELAAHRAEEGRTAVVEDAAVTRRQPVAAGVASGRSHDRRVELQTGRVTGAHEVTEGEQPAERGQHRVAALVDARKQADRPRSSCPPSCTAASAAPVSNTVRSVRPSRCRPPPPSCRRGRPATAGRRRRPGTRCGPCRRRSGCTGRSGTGGSRSGRSRSPAGRSRS